MIVSNEKKVYLERSLFLLLTDIHFSSGFSYLYVLLLFSVAWCRHLLDQLGQKVDILMMSNELGCSRCCSSQPASASQQALLQPASLPHQFGAQQLPLHQPSLANPGLLSTSNRGQVSQHTVSLRWQRAFLALVFSFGSLQFGSLWYHTGKRGMVDISL